MVIDVTVSAPVADPSKLRFAVDCADPPTFTLPKLKLAGDKLAPGASPTPVSDTTLVPALSAMATLPGRVPVAVGEKMICRVQVPFTLNAVGRVAQLALDAA